MTSSFSACDNLYIGLKGGLAAEGAPRLQRALHPRRTGWLDGTSWPPGRWWPWTQRCGVSGRTEDLLHYQVHAAADRARVFRLRALFPGYVAGDALHPRTWQPEQDERRWPLLHTLMDMESGWASVVTAGGLARGRVRTREDFEEGTYEAVWMRSGTPRLHWRERRAATQAADDAAPPAPRTTPPPALESLEDVLAVPEGHERPPWQQAYAHLRTTRWIGGSEPLPGSCCTPPSCRGRPEWPMTIGWDPRKGCAPTPTVCECPRPLLISCWSARLP